MAAAFVTLGSFFDIGVWYYVKDLKIFDDDVPETNIKSMGVEMKDTKDVLAKNGQSVMMSTSPDNQNTKSKEEL